MTTVKTMELTLTPQQIGRLDVASSEAVPA